MWFSWKTFHWNQNWFTELEIIFTSQWVSFKWSYNCNILKGRVSFWNSRTTQLGDFWRDPSLNTRNDETDEKASMLFHNHFDLLTCFLPYNSPVKSYFNLRRTRIYESNERKDQNSLCHPHSPVFPIFYVGSIVMLQGTYNNLTILTERCYSLTPSFSR